MRRLHVLFAGWGHAGRRTALAKLTGAPPEFITIFPDEVTAEVRTAAGEVIEVHGRVPEFGSLWFESWWQARDAEIEWARLKAISLFELLPRIDGVVFVADSTRLNVAVKALRRLPGDLARVGLDLDRIPVVFLHNQRDRPSAAPIEEMMSALSSPRCAHVESVAIIGHGVERAFDALVQMIDDPAARPAPPAPTPEVRAPVIHAPSMLFDEVTSVLTCDGDIRASLRTTTEVTGLALARAAVMLGWPKDRQPDHDFAAGEYVVDIAVRRAHARRGSAWKNGQPRVVAARVRLPGAEVLRREVLFAGRTYADFICVGAPIEVSAVEQDRIAHEAYVRADERGVALLAARGDRFEVAERGETALLKVGTMNEAHLEIGYDAAGSAVELFAWGDDGAAMLARRAP